ncbi:hypothetical protein AX15_004071 [Amanita polypyramis BW_CC]|nr:hypothetical protein AX15_004071 [Amanita polypyramis BW_CC]
MPLKDGPTICALLERMHLAPGSATFGVWAPLYQELGGTRFCDRKGVEDDLHRPDPAQLGLICLRCELMAEDHGGLTPLCVAVERSGSLALVEKLLERVDVNQINSYGETALYIAASYKEIVNPVAIVQQLVEAGVDPELRNEEGQTPLHLLMDCPKRALSCMPLLLQRS